ncbi:DUF1161 domain-containing protein [Xenorhabdus bovienii]|uniref:DUF1161 domain-containing protein n=1 Tax=Xenorhabdus bovienii TaxID=40576 RepID=UPI0023B25CF7|nr:DUF1161 domain-containing protein [Xenorhabdus bovienii]MDE9431802.1 DUF1161 domain-containing protein [Xenorhabdus bovienii]MDE9489528.1 DUF1161 domain-containing protein [Xenorhabdus bovienii]MDE9505781.1 DUF1161 domain-containing protein [Xenorhabdus bovienii]MDE9545910.1 DUF1161 domain-containing protein [Xenorhabdus bovienii]
MVKKILLTGALFFALAPFAVQASQKTTCESLKEIISQKIIDNHVAKEDFRLEVVPNDQVVEGTGKVVGSCDYGKQKIVYIRLSHTTGSHATSDAKEAQK